MSHAWLRVALIIFALCGYAQAEDKCSTPSLKRLLVSEKTPQTRFEEFLRQNGRGPTREEDHEANDWFRSLSEHRIKHPANLSPEVRRYLAKHESRSGRRPNHFVEDFLKQHNRLPKDSESRSAFVWIQQQLEMDEKDWQASDRLKNWLRRLKAQKLKAEAAKKSKQR